MQRLLFSLSSVLFVVFLCAASASAATTYFVAPAPAGSDANPGTEALPFLTIQKASNVAVAGDTIEVKPGTYAGAHFVTSGTSGARIIVHGMDGAKITSAGPGNTNLAGIWVDTASFVTIENFEVSTVAGAGIVVSAPGDPAFPVLGIIVQDNYVHDTNFGGIAINSTAGAQALNNEVSHVVGMAGIGVVAPSDSLLISGNLVHDNPDGGIALLSGATLTNTIQQVVIDSNTIYANGANGAAAISLQNTRNCLVVNNLVYGNHGRGVELVGPGKSGIVAGNQVFNNTIVQAADGLAPIALSDTSTGNSVLNTILLPGDSTGSIEIDTPSDQGLVFDYNDVFGPVRIDGVDNPLTTWQSLGFDTHSISEPASALFVSAGSNNYDLKAGSPAIDAGRFATGANVDIRGVARPQGDAYDIGAYEYFVPGPENHDPVANAGNDQTVASGATVNLNGTGSTDPDGDTLTFAWTQTAGPSVTLAGAVTATPSFTAPQLDADTLLTFLLTVSDGRGGTSSDSVTITVQGIPIPKITVTSPVAGESWKRKAEKRVRWFPDPGVTGDCRIELSRDGGQTFEIIIPSVSVTKGKKKWIVKGPPTTSAVVRVVLIADPRVQGKSGTFTIR